MSETEGPEAAVTSETFAVRRPIFDRHEQAVAYQLLFQGEEDVFPDSAPDDGANPDLERGWPTVGLSTLIGSKKACISFSRNRLVSGCARELPAGSAVINVTAEAIASDQDLLDECRALRKMGHLVAVESPVVRRDVEPFVSLAHIVKVSFQAANTKEKYDQLRQSVGDQPRLLAAQVDTREQYRQALVFGFDLVQGDFFLEPQIVEGRTISGSRLNYLKLLEVGNRPNPNIDELNTVIESDLTITHRLLKYLGAAAFGFRSEIRSVRHGLALLGQRQIQSFVSLVALDGMCDDKPHELLVTAAVRGKLWRAGWEGRRTRGPRGRALSVGRLVVARRDARPTMFDVLEELPLSGGLKGALLGRESVLQPVLDVVKLYENGEWAGCARLAHDHGIATTGLIDRYTEAVTWATAALDI